MKKFSISVIGKFGSSTWGSYVTLGKAKREFSLLSKNQNLKGCKIVLEEFLGYAKGHIPMSNEILATEIA